MALDSLSPLQLIIEVSEPVGTFVKRLLAQAEARERQHTRYLLRESVLRYLTGAQLEINQGNIEPRLSHRLMTHWAWDEDCSAHYFVGSTAYIVTGTPGNPTLATLQHLVSLGWKPIIISREDRIESTNDMLDESGLLPYVSAMSLEMLIFSGLRRKGISLPRSVMIEFERLISMHNSIVAGVHAPRCNCIEFSVVESLDNIKQ